MAQMRIFTLLLVIVLTSFSCGTKPQWDENDFFEQAFGIIEDISIKKAEIDWIDLKKIVRDSIPKFNNNEDAYRAISYTVKLINDGHSMFIDPSTPNKLTSSAAVDSIPIPKVPTRIINDNIGYLKLKGFIATYSKSKLYSNSIRKALDKVNESSDITGWIIDLRENSGGLHSMMPMGLAPLFEDSLIGYFVNNKGEYRTEYCTNEYFYFGSRKDSISSISSWKNKSLPIAVLVSNKTVSSGESLASALRFQPKTKLFGSRTNGKTTTLELFTFKSDAKLLLATQYICNKAKEPIYEGLNPDVECQPLEALELATNWINESHITGAKNP